MEKNYLYGLTVQGIQSYIFATNKLKEIIGASEIIEQLCTTWFYDFLTKEECKGSIRHLNAAGNIRFETDKSTAQRIFRDYHSILLEKAPGVPFSQAVVEIETDKEKEALEKLDKLLNAERNIPNQLDLGIMSRRKARRTGNAASLLKDADKELTDFSTGEKFENADKEAIKTKTDLDYSFPLEFKDLTKGGKDSWLALIHIDGNNMGNRINNIKDYSTDILTDLKEFSVNIEKATIKAFNDATHKIANSISVKENDTNNTLPMRPIVLGGDDVTLIIRADLAIPFVEEFLTVFEEETNRLTVFKEKAKFTEGLTACAGIAFIKEKFPFHYSSHLAEELSTHAKNKSGREASCLSFHQVSDSFIDDYNEIIKRELTTIHKFKFNVEAYYLKGKNTIKELNDTIDSLQSKDTPTNDIRNFVDILFHGEKSEIENKRKAFHKKNTNNNYTKIIENEKYFIDYLTLLSLENEDN
ncbi:MAG TPA: hypothetical protein EYG89_05585 [Bacteroidia bacterium]|nr:hypothetical protein [Bacteroidia bacterium]